LRVWQTTGSSQCPVRRPARSAAWRSPGLTAAGNGVTATNMTRVPGIMCGTGRGCQRRTRRGCGSASPAERLAPGRIWWSHTVAAGQAARR